MTAKLLFVAVHEHCDGCFCTDTGDSLCCWCGTEGDVCEGCHLWGEAT